MDDTGSDIRNAAPRQVCILVLPCFSNLTLSAVMEALRVANRVAGRTLFAWHIATMDGAPVRSSSGLLVCADAAAGADMLFVVASFEVRRHITPRLKALTRAAVRAGTLIAGMESGAYVLAAAGVLDGYRATTHWKDLKDLEEQFPAVRVVPDRFVRDRNRLTAGGALATLDAMLDLLRREHDVGLALGVSGVLIYEPDHAGREPQRRLPVARLALQDPALAAALRLMERSVEQPLPLSAIARAAGLSERGLLRRFRAGIGTTPNAHYTALRLSAGRRMLEHTDHDLAAIAVRCGFGSPSAFARAFRRRFGTSPAALRRNEQGQVTNQHGREHVLR